MNPTLKLPHDQFLYPLADIKVVRIANDRERFVHLCIELGAHVFAIEGHGLSRPARSNLFFMKRDDRGTERERGATNFAVFQPIDCRLGTLNAARTERLADFSLGKVGFVDQFLNQLL
jgi:hypothetical protein